MSQTLDINLTAAICLLKDEEPVVVTTLDASKNKPQLPSGNFYPQQHRTFAQGLRDWVKVQTQLDLGYVEQLYTFGDRGRHWQPGDKSPHIVSIGYLALTKSLNPKSTAFEQTKWYDFFPWEDWRKKKPALLEELIIPQLLKWVAKNPNEVSFEGLTREQKANIYFGLQGQVWDEEKVLERYELLYSAGLVEEAKMDGRETHTKDFIPHAMMYDHRRILATAIGRLRAKLKYRPLIFELISNEFTLTTLQKSVEAIAGKRVHKQNFRRLVENTDLVEPTGKTTAETGGRPAALYQFRRDVIIERPAPGLRFGA